MTLESLKNRATQIASIKPVITPEKSPLCEKLRHEIKVSLENHNTSTLDLLNQVQSVKTAKFLIEHFFPHGLSPSEDLGFTVNYILLISTITEVLKEEKFNADKPISILTINGMINPQSYAYLIFALDNAGLKSIELTILGNIDDIKNVDALKRYITQEQKSKRLSIITKIEYFKTIPELLVEDHRIDLYVYNLRITEPLMGTTTNNAINCRKHDESIIMYFPKQEKNKFFIHFSSNPTNLSDTLLFKLGSINNPEKIIIPAFNCFAFEEPALDIEYLINGTKKRNQVPIIFYTANRINSTKIATNNTINTIASIIRNKIDVAIERKIPGPTFPLYRWDTKTAEFKKYKDI
jgi:hypothetical protein